MNTVGAIYCKPFGGPHPELIAMGSGLCKESLRIRTPEVSREKRETGLAVVVEGAGIVVESAPLPRRFATPDVSRRHRQPSLTTVIETNEDDTSNIRVGHLDPDDRSLHHSTTPPR